MGATPAGCEGWVLGVVQIGRGLPWVVLCPDFGGFCFSLVTMGMAPFCSPSHGGGGPCGFPPSLLSLTALVGVVGLGLGWCSVLLTWRGGRHFVGLLVGGLGLLFLFSPCSPWLRHMARRGWDGGGIPF